MTSAIRQRGRDILRTELAEAAAVFCAERGFDTVTVDEIAQAIGISRATFFRFFASKEEVIVAAVRLGPRSLASEVRTSAGGAGARAMDSVRLAMESTVEDVRGRSNVLRSQMAIITESAGLRAYLASERSEQRAALEEALIDLVGDVPQARAVAHASMTAIDLAWTLWKNDDSADFGATLHQAFDLILNVGSVTVNADEGRQESMPSGERGAISE